MTKQINRTDTTLHSTIHPIGGKGNQQERYYTIWFFAFHTDRYLMKRVH